MACLVRPDKEEVVKIIVDYYENEMQSLYMGNVGLFI